MAEQPEHIPPKRDQTLRKGLRLIELLTKGGNQSLRHIAQDANLSKANAHQLLSTLIDEGFVYKDSITSQYGSTLKVWEIGQSQMDNIGLVNRLAPLMKTLRDEVNETVNLAILDGVDVLYIHKEDSSQGVRSFTKIGARAPVHCVATGKAMLAFDPRGESLWRTTPLPAFNTDTITDTDAFVAEMNATRKRGYATVSNEWRGEVRACAVPIIGLNGHVRAAIGISGPHNRMPAERMAELGRRLCECTQSGSLQLDGQMVDKKIGGRP